MTQAQPYLLLVDDEPINLHVLAQTLAPALGEEYALVTALDGERALRRLRQPHKPELVLLDVRMPGMDGYEICGLIKADPATRDIPVIFITGMSEAEDEAHGFELGGVDYIPKPFKPALVSARVKTHLELKKHRDRLAALAEERARALVHADRLATLGLLTASVAHEINNPLMYITGYCDLLAERISHLLEGPISPDAATGFLDEARAQVLEIRNGAERITSIVGSMRRYARKEDTRIAPCAMLDVVNDALRLIASRFRSVKVDIQVAPSLPRVMGNAQNLTQVFINLFTNAVDAMAEVSGEKRLMVSCVAQAARMVVVVQDNGPGIPPDKLEKIWDAFYTTKPQDKGTGLGLAISRAIMETHGGSICAENPPEGGARFVLTLPLASDTQAGIPAPAPGVP